MDIIEYRGFKNRFFALVKENDNYMILIANTSNIDIDVVQDEWTITSTSYKDFCIPRNIKAQVNIMLAEQDEALYHLIKIRDKQEYNTILKAMEILL